MKKLSYFSCVDGYLRAIRKILYTSVNPRFIVYKWGSRGNNYIDYLSRIKRKSVFLVPTRSDTNHALQPQKMARGLKFLILDVEGLYYLCSKNEDS